MCAQFIDLKVGVSLDPLCFNSLLTLWTLWTTFQVKDNVRSAPTNTAFNLVLHRSDNAHNANGHLRSSGERNGEQRRKKVSFSRTVMQCGWQKDTSRDKVMLNSTKINKKYYTTINAHIK